MRLGLARRDLAYLLVIVLTWSSDCALGAQRAKPQHEDPPHYSLTIASLPLGEALQEFSRQSGIQVIFFSRLTEGLRAPALDGNYSLAAAMTALLVNSKLTFRQINAKTVEIGASPRAPPDIPHDSGEPGEKKDKTAPGSEDSNPDSLNSSPVDEVVVLGSAVGLVATRTDTPLREIPQTISVISPIQIDQQNDRDLDDALDNAPGITAIQTDSLDQKLYSRGFQVTAFHIDGGPAQTSLLNAQPIFLGTPDLSEYDHIEVLRGADGLFGGVGNPGGTVDLVRKRPLDTEQASLSVLEGSWNNSRVEADITGPLAFDGALRGRLDVLWADRDYFYDTAHLRRAKVFAALEDQFTPSTVLTLGGSYQLDNARPDMSGLPFYSNGADSNLPRNTGLTFDWARYRAGNAEIYLQLRQSFGDGWTLKANTTAYRGTAQFAYGRFLDALDPSDGAALDPVTGLLPADDIVASVSTRPNEQRQLIFDLTLTGTVDWLGHRTLVALGGDYTRVAASSDFNEVQVASATPIDPRAYSPDSLPLQGASQANTIFLGDAVTTDEWGVFASLKTYLTADWSAGVGARVSGDRLTDADALGYEGFLVGATAYSGTPHKLTPYFGTTYDLSAHYSAFASYAEIYEAPGQLGRSDGSALGAIQGYNIDAGIKGAWRNDATNGTLVFYKAAQRNVPEYSSSPNLDLSPLPCCFTSNAANSSKGIDLELNGAVSRGWLIGGGYTLNITHLGGPPISTSFAQAITAGASTDGITPRHVLKLWTSKSLPGAFSSWSLGGTLRAQSSPSLTCVSQPIGPPLSCGGDGASGESLKHSYAVLDLRAEYLISVHWKAALTVTNVLDKTYYETLGPADTNNWYGEPRAATLRLEGRF